MYCVRVCRSLIDKVIHQGDIIPGSRLGRPDEDGDGELDIVVELGDNHLC